MKNIIRFYVYSRHNYKFQELNGKLNEFIEINRLKTLKAIANGYEAYEKAIEAVTKGRPFCVHARDLQQVHNDATTAALIAFCENRKITKDGLDLDKEKFSKVCSFKRLFQDL